MSLAVSYRLNGSGMMAAAEVDVDDDVVACDTSHDDDEESGKEFSNALEESDAARASERTVC